MSREDWVAIAARLFAVFLAVTAVRSVAGLVAAQSSGAPAFSPFLIAGFLAIALAVCALLRFFPLTVARRLLPVMKESRSESSMSASVALSVGLTLIGVWVLAYALPDAIYWVTLYLLNRQVDAGSYAWRPEDMANVLATLVELAVAIWLIFGSSGVQRLIMRYRYGAAADVS